MGRTTRYQLVAERAVIRPSTAHADVDPPSGTTKQLFDSTAYFAL